ncbi:MAG: hypothetical protein NTX53_13705 [candidate division WOR-3 bacterium]|nr:hypothetical protein [candidate division WOR-3 bacterium]
MNAKFRILAVLPAAILLAVVRCGTVTAVTPLHRGESAFAASVGGPVANVAGMDIPIPYAVARYRYGLNDQAGLYAGGHLLAAARGIIGLDFGFSYHFLAQKGWIPTVGTSAGIMALIQAEGNEALFPQLDLVASYRLGGRFLAYFGSQSMYQFRSEPNVVLVPFIGGEWRAGKRFSLALEAKWYAPTEPTHPRDVDYALPIDNHGAVGFVLGANWLFGGNRE